jgi:hypothetical protein
MYITYVYIVGEKKTSEKLISRKKIKKKLMQPLSIESVTRLDKCRVAFWIERVQTISSQEI